MEGGGWTEVFFVALGGPLAHDFSGPTARRGRRADNFVWVRGTAGPSTARRDRSASLPRHAGAGEMTILFEHSVPRFQAGSSPPGFTKYLLQGTSVLKSP
jgi:hypothetical protein